MGINPGAPLQVFVNGGPDLYHFDPGSFEFGVNLGLGLHVPAGQLFSFEATYDYNRALTPSPDLPFSQVMLGPPDLRISWCAARGGPTVKTVRERPF